MKDLTIKLVVCGCVEQGGPWTYFGIIRST